MINTTLFWLFLIPVLLSAVTIFAIPKLSGQALNKKDAAVVAGIALLISCLFLTASFFAGKGSKTADVQVFNGEVTGKTRKHDSYVESYECNCYTSQSCSGSGQNRSCTTTRHCSTCWRDHYTVRWSANTTLGDYTIEYKDWESRRVYNLPDPPRYVEIVKGDPVAETRSYVNYIKAVPESLFRPASEQLKQQFAGQIPKYPDSVFDFYKLNRVLPVGVSIPDLPAWNQELSIALKKLGPLKQANVVIVITKSNDPNYFYALQDAWLNGKKNDIIVVIGAPNFPQKAEWANIMALTDSEHFKVLLRDDILELEELTASSVIKTISENTMQNFKRKSMKDFAYLDNEIDPPTWLLVLSVVLVIAGYAVAWFVIVKDLKSATKFNTRFYRRV